MNIRLKITLIYLIALLIGLVMAGWIFSASHTAQQSGMRFTQTHLPAMRAILELRTLLIEQERLAYEYYATIEHDPFQTRFAKAESGTRVAIIHLENVFGPEALQPIVQSHARNLALFERLSENMRRAEVDWDYARELLEAITREGATMIAASEMLVGDTEMVVSDEGAMIQNRVGAINTLVAIFGVVLLGTVLLVAWFLRGHMKESALRKHQALHDALTDLPNRRHLSMILQERIDRGESATVVLLNLDRFRVLISGQGFAAGDALLVALGERIRATLNALPDLSGAVLGRFEGPAFMIILPGDRWEDQALSTLTRLCAQNPLEVPGRSYHFSLSVGIAVFPKDGSSAHDLISNADAALTDAKKSGNHVLRRYESALSEAAAQKLTLENDLRYALEKNELRLHYQPQLCLKTGRMIGFEALVRWQKDDQLVPPAHFIPLAEETGLIVPMGRWILKTACDQAAAWAKAGYAITAAVNISARQFYHPDFLATLQEVIAASGIDPARLELEITESLMMEENDGIVEKLNALRTLGCQLSIDDFGTGYSSLSYLKRFPLDKLKIDQSFVRNLVENGSDHAIIRAIVAIGHNLGLRVIAEGVETADQLALLKNLGCDEMQGYYFSRPVDAAAFDAILKEKRTL